MTGFMPDTDISSYIIKRRPATLAEKLDKQAEALNVSVITAAELRFGAEKAGRPKLTELVEAVSQGMTLVTNNLRHFSSVPGLKVEVWS
jgi:tRNA(fMet)-specific endonuclease VapC